MPLIQRFTPESGSEIAVWKVSETPDELLHMLNGLGIYADIPFFRNPSRLSEWLTARLLLAELGVRQRIRYNDAGKPHLEGDGTIHLSLSHSADYVAAIVHKTKSVGIDIEKTGSRILKVMHKFTGPAELSWIKPEDPERLFQLYQIWGAKECAFKIYGWGGLDFKSHLFVADPGQFPEGESTVTLEKQGKSCRYRVFFQYLDEMLLTYGFET